jgi:hypothetical protein
VNDDGIFNMLAPRYLESLRKGIEERGQTPVLQQKNLGLTIQKTAEHAMDLKATVTVKNANGYTMFHLLIDSSQNP